MVLRERRRTSGGWWPFGNLKGQRVLEKKDKEGVCLERSEQAGGDVPTRLRILAKYEE